MLLKHCFFSRSLIAIRFCHINPFIINEFFLVKGKKVMYELVNRFVLITFLDTIVLVEHSIFTKFG